MAIYAATFLACFLYMAAAYPHGAPESACNTFRPNHVDRSTGSPYSAKNENDQFELDNSECPYDVSYSNKFVPGESVTLTIRPRDSTDYFRGYMLTVVEDDDDNAVAQGEFQSAKSICGGSVVTQINGTRKTVEEIEWKAPRDGSRKTFAVWMTVVKSFSRYWMECNPIVLPAFDAEEEITSTTELPFPFPTEDIDDNDDNRTSIFIQQKSEEADKDSQKADDKSDKDEVSSSSMIESEENPNSEGQDESGLSDENSIDVSDNRSGSSLNSEEKEQKRKQYFEEGIENFDSDIKKLLVAVNKESLYEQFKSGAFTSGAAAVSGITALVTVAVAALTLA